MKAIIIAAGSGVRLKEVAKEKPKCLLEINGKSILEHQLDVYRGENIRDIVIVRGYQADKINVPGAKYYLNDNFKNNNILNSLMYAQEAMSGDMVVSYSDIIFGSSVLKALLNAKDEIAVIMDTGWEKHYQGRSGHPISEAEKITCDQQGFIKHIGKKLGSAEVIGGEFIGLFKCQGKGVELFKKLFHQAKREYNKKPFIKASVFDQAYITDFFQYMVTQGVPIRCIPVDGGWYEIDTVEDLQRVEKKLHERGLK